MATLIKRKGKYYARLRYRDKQQQKEIQIPLKTSLKSDAIQCRISIEKYEDDILKGTIQPFQFKELFEWLNADGTTALVKRSIQDIIPDYLAYRQTKVRLATANRDRISLNQLTDFFGKPKPIEELSYKDIEGANGLIQHLRNKGYKDSGINITLRHLKIFFNWLYKKERVITEPIQFDMIPEGEQLYCYFNESELAAIYGYNGVDDFFKRCWFFYEQTGCRAIEPMIGELVGDWLIIDSSKSKGKNVRQIQLNDKLKSILKEMQQFRDSYIKGSSKSHYSRNGNTPAVDFPIRPYPPNVRAYERISKTLKKVVRALDFKGKKLTMKSFRHTYAVRRITMCGNVFQVAMELGHRNVTTTQLYLRFPEQRRLADFPSLQEYIKKAENKPNTAMWDTDVWDTRQHLRASS